MAGSVTLVDVSAFCDPMGTFILCEKHPVRFWLIWSLLLLAFGSRAEGPVAAICVVQHQGKVLMVQDRVSDRFGITGGYIDGGETPEQAAVRELHEETGLVGEVLSHLGRIEHSRTEVFACRTREPLQVTADGAVNLLGAPNLGGEILSARLVNLTAPDVALRFPEHADWLLAHLPGQSDSAITELSDFSQQGMLLHRAELPWLRLLQHWLEPLSPLLAAANLFGEQALYLILLPLLLPWLGWQRLRGLLFALGTLALAITLLKISIGWPRPFHLDPALASQASSGFGMPSGHTATALLFWGLLLQGWPRCRHPMLWASLIALLTGLARVRLGVHFPSDVAGGMLLGAALLSQSERLARLAERPRAWWALSLLAMLAAWPTQIPALAALASLGVGISLGQSLPLQRQSGAHLLLALLALTGSLLCGLLMWQLPYLLGSTLLILSLQWLALLLLGLWLSAGIWWCLTLPLFGREEHERQEA